MKGLSSSAGKVDHADLDLETEHAVSHTSSSWLLTGPANHQSSVPLLSTRMRLEVQITPIGC